MTLSSETVDGIKYSTISSPTVRLQLFKNENGDWKIETILIHRNSHVEQSMDDIGPVLVEFDPKFESLSPFTSTMIKDLDDSFHEQFSWFDVTLFRLKDSQLEDPWLAILSER